MQKTVATKIAVAKTVATRTVKSIATKTAVTMTKKREKRVPAPTKPRAMPSARENGATPRFSLPP